MDLDDVENVKNGGGDVDSVADQLHHGLHEGIEIGLPGDGDHLG